MIVQYIYDGSYQGLFTAIFDIYARNCTNAAIVKRGNMDALSFADNIEVYTDEAKARRVLAGLEKKVSTECLHNLYCCYLSEIRGIENTILQFAQYVFSGVENAENNFGHPAVLEVVQTARKLGREKHRFEAFVRFENISERLFYAPIDPDYNVLPLIVPHFKRRYADQDWIIYDTKRKYGIHYDQQTETINEITIDFAAADETPLPADIVFDPEEKLYQELWKNYFKSVNIPVRKNRKLHLRHIPKRYWKYLVEKK